MKQWSATHRDNMYGYQREKHLKRKFGITRKQYQALLLSQGGVCAVCGKPETKVSPRNKKVQPLSIDHDHATGRVRGLLCDRCNRMLGFAQDDPLVLRAMAAYIERQIAAAA